MIKWLRRLLGIGERDECLECEWRSTTLKLMEILEKEDRLKGAAVVAGLCTDLQNKVSHLKCDLAIQKSINESDKKQIEHYKQALKSFDFE